MCGIVAYSGKKESVINSLVTGLKRLEYRGYDSAGIAAISLSGIYDKKTVGKVTNLERAVLEDQPVGLNGIGIAHTRWATHGEPTVANAHPHASADGRIWVVHNGIIENYLEIKKNLQKKGIKFTSQTDTEVVAKLIGDLYKGDLRSAVLETVAQLKGAFALCIISKDEPERLIGVKYASPLLVGIGKDELIIASDASAIIERTKKVVYLEDGELVDINKSDYEVVSFQDEAIHKSVEKIDWDVDAASKQGYEHYLLKEIMEQPEAIENSLRGRIILDEADVRFGGLMDVSARLKDINRVVLLGVGTSYYSAKLGELYFNALTSIPATAAMSPEYRYTKNNIDKNTWLIAVSQSGETADTIAAIEEAKRHGALVTGLVNVVGSSISRMTDAGVYNHTGPEISVASTKAFTSQSLLLLMHAILLGRQQGLDFSASKKLIRAVVDLPNSIGEVLKSRDLIEKVASSIRKDNDLFYLGRQYNYPIALEGALKIKELAYIHAEGLSGGELKHGFIALIEPGFTTIAIATDDVVKDKMIANIAEVKARKGRVVAIANEVIKQADATVVVPNIGSDMLQPLVNNIALQLIAYYVAKERKLDIDQPRNLAKSVTVE